MFSAFIVHLLGGYTKADMEEMKVGIAGRLTEALVDFQASGRQDDFAAEVSAEINTLNEAGYLEGVI